MGLNNFKIPTQEISLISSSKDNHAHHKFIGHLEAEIQSYFSPVKPKMQDDSIKVIGSVNMGKISSAHISTNNLDIIQEVIINKNER